MSLKGRVCGECAETIRGEKQAVKPVSVYKINNDAGEYGPSHAAIGLRRRQYVPGNSVMNA